MNCRNFQQNIADYVAERLSSQEREQMLVHSRACVVCQQALLEETALRSLFSTGTPQKEMPDLWPQVAARLPLVRPAPRFPRMWVYRSGFATAAALLTLFVWQSRTPVTPINTVLQPATVAKETLSDVDLSYASQFEDMHNIGKEESNLLLASTHTTGRIGLSDSPEGDRP